MGWHDELREIVERLGGAPSFEQWLDASGHRTEVQRVMTTGPVELQARALAALYDYYRTQVRRND